MGTVLLRSKDLKSVETPKKNTLSKFLWLRFTHQETGIQGFLED